MRVEDIVTKLKELKPIIAALYKVRESNIFFLVANKVQLSWRNLMIKYICLI